MRRLLFASKLFSKNCGILKWKFLFVVLASLSKINEAIDGNDAAVVLACLQLPTAKLNNVKPKNAELYMIILKQAKKEKAEVGSSCFLTVFKALPKRSNITSKMF